MIDKIKIADSFGRSASQYDAVAYLQREIGNELFEKIDTINAIPLDIDHCLDLGCGTGYFQKELQKRFASANHTVCDLAEGMLSHVKQQQNHQQLICADAESLPIKNESFEFIFSNLALQWCENIETVFAEAHRILKPKGFFCLSTLGPKTLFELKHAWAEVDQYQHVNTFYGVDHWLSKATNCGFKPVEISLKEKVLFFDSPKQLTYELKQLGAHNMNAEQSQALTSKSRWQRFVDAYQKYCHDSGQFPATYEVYYLCLQR